jgi:hypothetical protein
MLRKRSGNSMGNRKEERVGLWLCTGLFFLLTLVMVKVEMGKGHEVLLYSDFATHSTWAVGELPDPLYDKFYAYPVWHFLVRAVNLVLPLGREWAGALVTACFMGVTAAVLYRILWGQLGESLGWKQMVLLDLGLLFLTALYMPWFNPQVYLGQSSPTIWHNPTNMAVKPVALLAFWGFVRCYERYQKISWKALGGLSVLLLLSCFIKPSFIQGFLPAVVVFLFLELLCTRGDSFFFSLKMALAFVPSGLYFLFQFFSVFGQEAGRGIGIAPFAVMLLDTSHPLISMVQAAAFPLFVLWVLGGKQIWKDKPLLFSVIFYLVSLLEFILLIEVTEPASGNFEWAYQLALFTLFIVTAVRFYQRTGKGRGVRLLGNGLLLYHVGSGIYYYLSLLLFNPLQC